jgi:chromosomal replication initiation ATPase DnaA
MDYIKELVLEEFSISEESFESTKRDRLYSDARKAYSFLKRKHENTNYEAIGSSMNRDHSTAMYQFKMAHEHYNNDEAFKEHVEAIRYIYFKRNKVTFVKIIMGAIDFGSKENTFNNLEKLLA